MEVFIVKPQQLQRTQWAVLYEAVTLMGEARKKANLAEPAKYLPDLAKTNYKGLTR